MSYTKKTWVCDEYISASDLNHIEDGIEANALPAVTSADEGKVLSVNEDGQWVASEDGGSCDCGFDCQDVYTQVFSGTVTPNPPTNWADISGEDGIYLGERIKVSVDGIEYEATARPVDTYETDYGAAYDPDLGGYDFSVYPFSIEYIKRVDGGEGTIVLVSSEQHDVAVWNYSKQATVTPCFSAAVAAAEDELLVHFYEDDGDLIASASFKEIQDAISKGKRVRAYRTYGSIVQYYELTTFNGVYNFTHISQIGPGYASLQTISIGSDNALHEYNKSIS